MNIIDMFADMANIGGIGHGIEKFGGILILIMTLLWILIIIGVARNISKRTDMIWMQILCIIIATLGGPLGLIIYLIIRPSYPEYIEEYYTIITCPKCEKIQNNTYDYCTQCGILMKKKCKECGKMIDPSVEYCGYCGAPNL
ncbi:MAG: hypothetical protein CR971_02215 [candidate division SR1 bacterium]|nr:MAG: hypothetical protein CR971_02215 [candidate division SR1 bacterium]